MLNSKIIFHLLFAGYYFLIITDGLRSFHPLSDEYISWINRNQSHWKAGKNFDVSEWFRVKNMASGVWRQPFSWKEVQGNKLIESSNIPEYFDSRDAWPHCKSIIQIWDQSHCGSCWAFSAAAAMSDRVCIHSGQLLQLYISAEDLLSCCWQCGKGCLGGEIPRAWWYWHSYGIVTGGLYSSSQGCKDYSLPPCEHHIEAQSRPPCDDLIILHTPKCVNKCYDNSLNYEDCLTFGSEVKQFTEVSQIQREIFTNGPVEGAIDVFDDFFSYKSGVYKRTSSNYIGGHAIKILGWGKENGIPYWLCANSWNSDWGDSGYFKIIRGENHCGVEDQVFASLPLISSLFRFGN